jgi:hypothetical protein
MLHRASLATLIATLGLVGLVGCSGDPPKTVDAPAAAVDGPAAGAFGATCVTPTDTSTECTSGVCTNSFDMLGHSVCSQKCTVFGGTDPTCPTGAMGQKCNMKGYCKP